VDCDQDRKIIAWQRGYDHDPVIVVANFSGWGSSDPWRPESEYVVANWPRINGEWREITGNRIVPEEWAGREPIYPWEAKVYRVAR